MGDWTLIVSGTGCHHNNADNALGIEEDADQQLFEFADLLTRSGHTLRHAAIVHCGGADVVEFCFTETGLCATGVTRADGSRITSLQAHLGARRSRRNHQHL